MSERATEQPAPPRRDTIRVVTWNVWFDAWLRRERWTALWEELKRLDPDVVCLQEVVPSLVQSPALQALENRGYWLSDDALGGYDVLMASRLPLVASERLPLPSDMRRNLLLATFGTTPPLTVATVHLESTAPATARRVEQLERIVARLEREAHAVFVGDMNFPDGERPEAAVLGAYRDAWPSVHHGDPGYTVDTRANEMRYLHKGHHGQERLDRVFVKSDAYRVTAIERLGLAPLAGDPLSFVSDHFGLAATLER